jgi:4'-phosphopantetheinyl transferase
VIWTRPAARIDLRPGETHVWRLAVDVPEAQRRQLASSLSADERDRAARFGPPAVRRRFVVARATLRAILSRYVDRDPRELRFADGGHGKPVLAGAGPHFNVSHSGALVLYAVSGRAVGVDVERVRTEFDWRGAAAQFLSPCEGAALRALGPEGGRAGFFTCWTRKEAYLKARGVGLLAPLDCFDVSVGPDAPAELLGARGELDDARSWWLHDCEPAPGYAATVAGEGRLGRLICWDWDG